MPYLLTSLDKASSAEVNDTKIIKFGWVILNLWLLLEYGHFQISLDFCVLGKPIDPCHGNKRNTDQWASTNHHMEGFSRHNSSLIGRKNQAKFEHDCISRNGHRIKITQQNLMIFVSFSSAEDALSNDVQKYNTLPRKVGYWKTARSAFFGTPGIYVYIHTYTLYHACWLLHVHTVILHTV